jgi:tripartite-type tricarboxylate transporter receptor subunit TctC
LILLGGGASAQTSKTTTVPSTIRVVVPSSAGGGADILARVLAERINRDRNVALVVDDRPGASNTIGTEIVSRAAPDGGTLLIATPEFVINPHLRKLNYDPVTSFVPICYLVRAQQLIAVNSASPYRSLDDLLNAARHRPDELTLASAGPGSGTHLAFETLKRLAGVRMTYVPYQGSAAAVNALLGGYVTAALASAPNLVEHISAGKIRALATVSANRLGELPDVPTVAESGFPNYGADIWFGVVAPAATPQSVILELGEWFAAALEVPEVQSRLKPQGLSIVGLCGADFGAFIRQQYDLSGRAVRDANLGTE